MSAAKGKARRKTKAHRKIVVLKFGGELLEDSERLAEIGRAVARIAKRTRLVVVHGGGREIDAALTQASIPKHTVDGVRITDEPTLQIVIGVLAGSINTRLVTAINAAGGTAVGLTGADAGVAPVKPAGPHRATNGELVDLGLVGEPVKTPTPQLIEVLTENGYIPVIASIASSKDGRLFNVNADTLAGSLAARLGAKRLVMGGATAGVFDTEGNTIATLDDDAINALFASGTVTAGMVAKLRACQRATEGGVAKVMIADARSPRSLRALVTGKMPRGTGTRIK